MALSTETYADRLFSSYESYRMDSFPSRRFSPETLHSILETVIKRSSVPVNVRTVGNSFEGRPVRLFSVGSGKISVLLWSQMHGDESTATMAITDILNYAAVARDEVLLTLLSELTVHFLPMANPDGAARFQRRTAQGIDMNRDALALRTPEARILKQLQHDLQPQFGFNLHDQELSTVGTSNMLSAIALLAPAFDREKSDNPVRTKAKHLAAAFARTVNVYAAGMVSRYDDGFESRAFGDNMQKWKTSTLLVESGHTMNDPEKNYIRKLNFVGILASLRDIASGEYLRSTIDNYESLPFNGKKVYSLIIRNISIDHGGGEPTRADLGISYQVDTHTESTPMLVDIGDLQTYVGLKEIDGNGLSLPQHLLALGKPFEWETHFPS